VELGARLLLTGRVAQRGDVVDIQAELVDAQTDAQVWGQRFTRETSDLLTVQADIAREMCDVLKVRLSPAERSRLTRARAVDPEAYREYLRGRHLYNRWSKESLLRAADAFNAAVARDPSFAPAYAGLADAYGASAYYGYLPAEQAYPRAFAAGQQALALDPDLAEAHAGVALGHLFFRWDWEAAGASLEKAIALNSQYAAAHTNKSLYLCTLGRHAEALAEARAGEALDPLSLLSGVAVAWALMFSRDLEGALQQAHRVLDLDPTFFETKGIIVGIHERQGRFEQAISHLRTWLPSMGTPAERADQLLEAYRTGGADAYWRARLALFADWACVPVLPWLRAELHARLREAEPMFAALHEAVAMHLGPCVFLKVDPHFEEWRSDPRFEALVQRVGIP
jgi:tetratricopeptide (TPR) repeat protein